MKYFTCDRSTNDKALRYFVTSKLSENIQETPEGFLVCIGVPIARTGSMTYGEGETPLETDSKGVIEISRSEDEVFRPETIASFEGKPITITHPTEFVSPENWSRLAKGVLQNIRRGEGEQKDDLIADLLITDKMAIDLVKNGLREVSCGYEADYTQTDKGRGVQSNIIGNHLALVDEGRAGSSYAITDHKGASKMKLSDKIRAIFAKAQDEAMKVAKDEAEEKKDDKKSEDADEEKGKSADAAAYDELKKSIDALVEKVAAMGSPTVAAKDEEEKADEKVDDADPEKKEEAKDEEAGMEDRLKALEEAVKKLLAKSGDEEMESEDAEEKESEDDFGGMTGDTASRIEILAPGLDAKTKDAKVKALKAAYATKDGKKVIEALTGGKAPKFESAEKVDTLFIAASELLKVQRSEGFSKTKQTRDSELNGSAHIGAMTAEKMNELNAKHYKKGVQ